MLEGLPSVIHLAVDRYLLKGVVSCHGGVKVSHLLCVDDNLLICEAITKECQNLMRILAIYETASGQTINRQKTTLFFSPNTKQQVQLSIWNMLGAQVMTSCEKYLGLPMVRQVQGEHF